MIRTFIQILALMTTIESAIFLARGSLRLSAEAIAALGGTYVGYNPHLVQSLAQQTADCRAGVILLLVAFSLQMGNTLWPIRWKDFAVSKKGAVWRWPSVSWSCHWLGGWPTRMHLVLRGRFAQSMREPSKRRPLSVEVGDGCPGASNDALQRTGRSRCSRSGRWPAALDVMKVGEAE